jgi:hypothetical protein
LWSLPSFAALIVGSMLTPPLARRFRHAFVMAAELAAADGWLRAVRPSGRIVRRRAGHHGSSVVLSGSPSSAPSAPRSTATIVAEGIPSAVSSEQADAARDTLGGAVAAGEELPAPLAAELLDAAREAFVQGLHVAALTSAVIAARLAVLIAGNGNHRQSHHAAQHGPSELRTRLAERARGDSVRKRQDANPHRDAPSTIALAQRTVSVDTEALPSLDGTHDHRRQKTHWLALVVLCFGQFMVVLDTTIVTSRCRRSGRTSGSPRQFLLGA